jgi:hypothetical protein
MRGGLGHDLMECSAGSLPVGGLYAHESGYSEHDWQLEDPPVS